MRALVLPLVAIVALAACGPTPAGSGGARPGTAANGAQTLKIGQVTGKVIAPAGWKAGDKAPATAIDVSKKKFTLLEKGEAVGSVEVWLGTPKRERFKGPTVATTNLKGEFVIKGVPKDLAYVVYSSVVNAKGEVLVKTQAGGGPPPPPPPPQPYCAIMPQQPTNQPPRPVTISFASTVVVNDMFKDLGNELGKVDWAAYGKMVAAVDAKLDINALPDLNDTKALSNFLGTVTVDGKAYSQAADAFKTAWKSAAIDVGAAQQILNGLPSLNITGSVAQDGQTVAAGGGDGTIVLPAGIDLGGLFGGGTEPVATAAPVAEPTAAPAVEPTAAPAAVPTASPAP